jgi:hypothetical protein
MKIRRALMTAIDQRHLFVRVFRCREGGRDLAGISANSGTSVIYIRRQQHPTTHTKKRILASAMEYNSFIIIRTTARGPLIIITRNAVKRNDL